MIGRARRTVDRVLTDPRGLRLAFSLASEPTTLPLVPDAIGSIWNRGQVASVLPAPIARMEQHQAKLGPRVRNRVWALFRVAVAAASHPRSKHRM